MPVNTTPRRAALARQRGSTRQRGSMMVEVLVSVVLLSVSILGLVRVLGNTVKDSGELEYRSVAAALADESIGRMWLNRANLAGFVVTNQVVAQLPTGRRTIAVTGNRATVTITWQAPGRATASQHQITATIAGN